MTRRLATIFLLTTVFAAPASAQWIQVTVDIDGGRWQVTSDASVTIFNRWGNIAWDGYIGASHRFYTPNLYQARYPTNLGRILSSFTRTAPTGSALPPGCAHAEIHGQDYDAQYETEPQSLRSSTLCWEDPPDDSSPGGPDDQNHSALEPLILDLNGDGIWTTALADDPVWFDLNGNGVPDRTAWTAPGHEDGFLYVDWNRNRIIDGGQELFGDASVLPDATLVRHGYEALAAHDNPAYGGNGDGVISHNDRIWPLLRLWIDRNHDAFAQNDENYALNDAGVIELSLTYRTLGTAENYGADVNGNQHMMQGSYTQRIHGQTQQRLMHEVYFRAEPH